MQRTLWLEGGDAGAYLDRALERAGEDALRTAFMVLGRLSEDQPQDAEPWIAHVLERDVASRAMAAFEAAKAVGQRTAHARLGMVLARALERDGTVELAARMARAGLPELTVSLREVVRWVEKKRVEHLPKGSELETLVERAGLLNNLGGRQRELGQREAALASPSSPSEPQVFRPAPSCPGREILSRYGVGGMPLACGARSVEADDRSVTELPGQLSVFRARAAS